MTLQEQVLQLTNSNTELNNKYKDLESKYLENVNKSEEEVKELQNSLADLIAKYDEIKSQKLDNKSMERVEMGTKLATAISNTLSTGWNLVDQLRNAFDGSTENGAEMIFAEIERGVDKKIYEDPILGRLQIVQIFNTDKYKRTKLSSTIEAAYEDDITTWAVENGWLKTGVVSYVTATIYVRVDLYIEAVKNIGSHVNIDIMSEVELYAFNALRNFISNKVLNGWNTEAIRGIKNSPSINVTTSTSTTIEGVSKKDVNKFLNSIDSIYGNDILVLGSTHVYTELSGARDANEEIFKEIVSADAKLIRTMAWADFEVSKYAPSQNATVFGTTQEVLVAFVPSQYVLVNQANSASLDIGYINDNMAKQLKTVIYRKKYAGWLLNDDACAILKTTV